MKVLLPLLLGASACVSSAPPVVHVFRAGASGIFANAYLVESDRGVVAVDATLTVSDAKMFRAKLDALKKPLLAVLITHGHPDHYNGLTELVRGLDVPIYAAKGADQIIRRDDAKKEAQWKPMFGAEWPEKRTFPTKIAADGELVEIGGMRFTLHELGPGESHFDSWWSLEGEQVRAFVGDTVFNGMHAYLSDGHSGEWLENLAVLEAALPPDAVLYAGHGADANLQNLGAMRSYLSRYREAVRRLSADGTIDDADKAALVLEMKQELPTDALEFLIALGAEPVAAELAGP